MKKIKKNFNKIPSSLSSKGCDNKIATSLVELGAHKFSGAYYASAEIKRRLAKIYNNKCAFCENDTTAGASLQVEHYRPKAKVTEDIDHPGYYWLGYEWSNLLYACSKCNRYKANFFPIKQSGTRKNSPPLMNGALIKKDCRCNHKDYLNEHPLIINPEMNDPRSHFLFLPTGKIKGNTEEGTQTILKCKLYRNPLVIARKKIISDVLHELKKVIYDYRQNNVKLDTVNYIVKNEVLKLTKIINDNESFSELARSAISNFEYFFIRRFGNKNDRILLRKIISDI